MDGRGIGTSKGSLAACLVLGHSNRSEPSESLLKHPQTPFCFFTVRPLRFGLPVSFRGRASAMARMASDSAASRAFALADRRSVYHLCQRRDCVACQFGTRRSIPSSCPRTGGGSRQPAGDRHLPNNASSATRMIGINVTAGTGLDQRRASRLSVAFLPAAVTL